MPDEMKIRLQGERELTARIKALKEGTMPQSPLIRQALTRVANLIVSQAKVNIRRKQITDTGRLLNSIRFEFLRPDKGAGTLSVLVGSFGVPYAAVHEFGHTYQRDQMRAMFYWLSRRGKGNRDKGIMKGNRLRARPYLRPAFMVHKDRVATEIAKALEAV